MQHLHNKSISKVYGTVVSGVIVTSVILLGNGSTSVMHNYRIPRRVVSSTEGRTNMYWSYSYVPEFLSNVPVYSYSEANNSIEELLISDDKVDSYRRLEDIAQLQDNWNGNGAKAISNSLIAKTRNLVMLLNNQPEIFPTACDSIQIEYDNESGAHLEIELTENEMAELFMVDSNGDETIKKIKSDSKTINEVVNRFYG